MFKYEGSDAATAKAVKAFDNVDAEALAILESQMLNYRARSSQILADGSITTQILARVYATGGAAKNQSICNVMADALDCPVSKPIEWDEDKKKWKDAHWNACSVGVAYKARWGWERHVAAAKGDEKRAYINFDDFIAECTAHGREKLGEAGAGAEHAGDVAVPGEGAAAYAAAVEWWTQLEHRALSEML